RVYVRRAGARSVARRSLQPAGPEASRPPAVARRCRPALPPARPPSPLAPPAVALAEICPSEGDRPAQPRALLEFRSASFMRRRGRNGGGAVRSGSGVDGPGFVRAPGPRPAARLAGLPREQQRALDLLDRLGHLDAAGARVGAVEGGAAPPHALGVVEDLQTLRGALVAGVEDEPVRVDDRRRAEVRPVRPEDRAGGR